MTHLYEAAGILAPKLRSTGRGVSKATSPMSVCLCVHLSAGRSGKREPQGAQEEEQLPMGTHTGAIMCPK